MAAVGMIEQTLFHRMRERRVWELLLKLKI